MAIELNATVRDDMGKGASRRLRHANKLPAIVYGAGKDPVNLTLEQKDVQYVLPSEAFYSQILSLNVDGKKEDVLLRDLQHHPYKIDILHMDFVRVDAKVAVHVHVPLHFIGEDVAPGAKAGGLITHELIEVALDVLPRNLPEFIEVDVSALEVGESLHLSDLPLPEGGSLVELARGEGHDLPVVSIHVRRGGGETEGDAAVEGGEAAAEDES